MSHATPFLRAFALALAVALGLSAPPLLAQSAGELAFHTPLTGSQEVPANGSRASGHVTATLDGMTLTVTGTFSGLESDYNTSVGAHIHLGFAGENGPVNFPLTPTLDGNLRGGFFAAAENTLTLSEAQVAALMGRRYYVNIHTVNLPAGEIRGQLAPVTGMPHFAALSGAWEVPANASRAIGGVLAELDGMTLTVTGAFSGLESDYNTDIGAHLHLGFAGENGPVEISLQPMLSEDNRSGQFMAANNTFELTAEQVAALQARRLYVNVHTMMIPAGEVRGQLVPADAVQLASVFSGRAEVPANGSQARGGAVVELDGMTVVVTGAFSGLLSDYNTSIGAHLHLAPVGQNGPVVFPLHPMLGEDNRSGRFPAANNTFTVTPEQAEAFASGQYYVNIHTVDLPPGEIRGQVLPLGVRVFEAWLVGANEIPAVMSPGSGGVLALLMGDQLTVAGGFRNLGSAFNTDIGAHLHLGAANENGPVDIALETMADEGGLGGSFPASGNTFTLTAAQRDALFEGRYYVNVHTVDNPPGELRGQVLPSTNLAPMGPTITSPMDGATVVLEGPADTPFVATWTGSDPNTNPTFFTWQLSTSMDFGDDDVVFSAMTGRTMQFETTFGAVDSLLASLGVGAMESITVFHRVRATDGSFPRFGPAAAVTLTRTGTVSTEGGAGAVAFALRGAAPNPMRGHATLTFDLPEAADVTVEVYDVMGRQVLMLPLGERAAGAGHAAPLAADGLAAGTYIVRLRATTAQTTLSETTRVTVVR